MEGIKVIAQKYEKVNFVHKDLLKNLSSHNVSKKFNEQWGVLQKKAVFKNFLRKHPYWSLFFNENAGL